MSLLPELDSCCAFGMAIDSGGTHQADGIRMYENNILDLLGSSISSGGEHAHALTIDHSTFCSRRCAERQQQF